MKKTPEENRKILTFVELPRQTEQTHPFQPRGNPNSKENGRGIGDISHLAVSSNEDPYFTEIAMRQYVILYKRSTGGDFSRLNPTDHSKLIDHDEVREAIELMRQRLFLEGICVRLENELFNVMSFTQEAIAPNAFTFEEGT